jgi:hypothetical protein
MTTTYENLNKWYNTLLDKFGRIMLDHMNYKQGSYDNELNKFIEKSTNEINMIIDTDRKRYLTTMRDHITELQQKFNTIKNIKGSIKRTRRTSAYNKYIRDNFAIIKKDHPEWSNEEVMKYVVSMWNQLEQKGGDDPYDYDIETGIDIDYIDQDITNDYEETEQSGGKLNLYDENTDDLDEVDDDMLDYSGGEFEQNGGKKNYNDEMMKWKKQIRNLYL